MKFTLIKFNEDGHLEEVVMNDDNLIEMMAREGKEHVGYEFSPPLREELKGQPKFSDCCGPMWNGDHVRYENWDVYERLSV